MLRLPQRHFSKKRNFSSKQELLATCSVHRQPSPSARAPDQAGVALWFCGRTHLILRPDSPHFWSPACRALSLLLSHPDPVSPGQGKALLFSRARPRPSHKDSRQTDPAARMLTGWRPLRSRPYLAGFRSPPPQSSISAEKGTRSRPPARGGLGGRRVCPFAPEPLAAWRRGRRRSFVACGAAA